jgi:hypothetical protein
MCKDINMLGNNTNWSNVVYGVPGQEIIPEWALLLKDMFFGSVYSAVFWLILVPVMMIGLITFMKDMLEYDRKRDEESIRNEKKHKYVTRTAREWLE